MDQKDRRIGDQIMSCTRNMLLICLEHCRQRNLEKEET